MSKYVMKHTDFDSFWAARERVKEARTHTGGFVVRGEEVEDTSSLPDPPPADRKRRLRAISPAQVKQIVKGYDKKLRVGETFIESLERNAHRLIEEGIEKARVNKRVTLL